MFNRKLYFIYILLLSFILCSCASLESGRYVRIKRGDTLRKISKSNNLSVDEFLDANPKLKLIIGKWVFIPQNRGILNHYFNKHKYVYSNNGKIYAMAWPVPKSKKITSYYGMRRGRHHDGLDIYAPFGTKIIAVNSGKVIYSGRKISGYGNMTIISHRNGLHTVYAHAAKNYTRKGDWVKRGEVIALIGSTGRSSGPHLHFEVRWRGKAKNPMAYLRGALGSKLAYKR